MMSCQPKLCCLVQCDMNVELNHETLTVNNTATNVNNKDDDQMLTLAQNLHELFDQLNGLLQ